MVSLQGYRLGTYPWGGTFGHAYVVVTDTRTGESYVFRGGPSGDMGPHQSAAVSNSPANGASNGPITLTAQIDPYGSSPDTERGGYSDQAGGSESIASSNLGEMSIGDVVDKLTSVRDLINTRQDPYLAQTHNSNTAAGSAYTALTGDAVAETSKYPGIANPIVPPPPPPPPDVDPWLPVP